MCARRPTAARAPGRLRKSGADADRPRPTRAFSARCLQPNGPQLASRPRLLLANSRARSGLEPGPAFVLARVRRQCSRPPRVAAPGGCPSENATARPRCCLTRRARVRSHQEMLFVIDGSKVLRKAILAFPSWRRRLPARADGGDADRDQARDQGKLKRTSSCESLIECVRRTQRDTSTTGSPARWAALDRRCRDARSRATVPQDHGPPRPRDGRCRDRPRPRSQPSDPHRLPTPEFSTRVAAVTRAS